MSSVFSFKDKLPLDESVLLPNRFNEDKGWVFFECFATEKLFWTSVTSSVAFVNSKLPNEVPSMSSICGPSSYITILSSTFIFPD